MLRTGRLLREDFLQQSSFDPLDASCAPLKQHAMLRVIVAAHRAFERALAAGRTVDEATTLPALREVARMRAWPARAESRARPLTRQIERGGGAMTRLVSVEHRTVTYVAGPLLVAEHTTGIAYDDLVDVVAPDGELRRGQVLEVDGDRVVVQVFAGTRGLDRPGTIVRARGEAARLGVGRDLIGRILDGSGEPIDGGPPVIPEAYRDVNGLPLNPIARDHPSDFIETGISAIDGLNTLVRGQKLPIFSGFGLPANELAARIAAGGPRRRRRAVRGRVRRDGCDRAQGAFYRERFASGGALERSVLFLNPPPIPRSSG